MPLASGSSLTVASSGNPSPSPLPVIPHTPPYTPHIPPTLSLNHQIDVQTIDSEFGSQVRTASEIPPNSRLLTCPHALAIDYTKVKAHFSPAFVDATTPHAALCMFLVYQWLRGEESFWWPYLRVLPREFDTPLYFEDDDLMWLQGCNLDAKEAEERKRTWMEELGAAVAALKKDGVATVGYTW